MTAPRGLTQQQPFVIGRDARGALVHVRRKDTGECVGCIEAGLYEVVGGVIEEEVTASAGEALPAEAAKGERRS
jgi:hypothetical protein